MDKISLKLKITLWYVGILVLVSFLILYAMTVLNRSVLTRHVEDRLITSVLELSHVAFPPGRKDYKIDEPLLYVNGVQMTLYDGNGNLLAGFVPFEIVENSYFEEGTLRQIRYSNKDYYVFDKVVVFNWSTYWIRGIICLTDELEVLNLTTNYSFVFILIFILLAGIGGYFIILRAFVPVNKIRLTAKEISESSDLSRRINIGAGGDEIHILATTFDEMLDKLEYSFNKEKQFTSDASHELRTPISVILTECEYGEECVEDVAELKEILGSIKGQANKMSKLVSELLMISRMDNNRVKLNFEKIDLSELLSFVCDEQVEIQTKNITLERHIIPELYIMGDRLLLTRLFINLISNAYQYSNSGTKIIVSLNCAGDKVIFSVKDEGIGILEENIMKIWDRFYQVDSSRTENENGSSGLGLPMVKWISDCHKGELRVNSELNKGSEFIFSVERVL